MTKKNKNKSAETDKMRATATMNMLGSRWMKNAKSFFIILCLLTIITTQAIVPTKAQNNADSLALLIYIEDAIGQKDSVFVYIKQGATDGFDPELGEINLYGSPMKDPEIRIVQRTDTNAIMDTFGLKGPYWLTGMYGHDYDPYGLNWSSFGFLKPYKENVDLKKNYIYNLNQIKFAFQINATNYPVIINALKTDSILAKKMPQCLTATKHNAIDGSLETMDGLVSFTVQPNDCDDYYFNDYHRSIIVDFNIDNSIIFLEWNWLSTIKYNIHKSLHPNPASDVVALEDCNFDDEYVVFNNAGIVVKSGIIDNTDCIINIFDLQPSTYYIKTSNNVYKLVKESK